MQRPSWTAHAVDGGHPGHARALAVRALADWPELARALRADRAFLRRAVRALVDAGIGQFLDLGAGIPTVGDVRTVARASRPRARVMAVDVDPGVVERTERLLADDPDAGVVHADALDVDAVLAAPSARALLDPDLPVGVIAVGWVHVVTDDAAAAAALAGYRDATAPGSHLVLTHAAQECPDDADQDTSLYRHTGTPLAVRTRDAVAALLDGYEVLEPGVVPVTRWRPDEPVDDDLCPERFTGYAAVGRRG